MSAENATVIEEEEPIPDEPDNSTEQNENKNVPKKSKTTRVSTTDRVRAISNYERGILDPEYNVMVMSNGKYRVSKRKVPLVHNPINVNQVPENKPTQQVQQQPNFHEESQIQQP